MRVLLISSMTTIVRTNPILQDLQYAFVLVVNVLDVTVYTAAMVGARTHHVSREEKKTVKRARKKSPRKGVTAIRLLLLSLLLRPILRLMPLLGSK